MSTRGVKTLEDTVICQGILRKKWLREWRCLLWRNEDACGYGKVERSTSARK